MENFGWIFYSAVSSLSFGLLVLATCLGLYKYTLLYRASKWYIHYLGFIFIIESMAKTLRHFKMENLFLYPYYVAGEFFILSVMFILAFNISRKAIWVTGILSVFLFLTANQSFLLTNNTSGNFKILSHLMILYSSGYYMIRALSAFNKDRQDSFLPIYGGLFLYYSVSLILFLLLEQSLNLSDNNAALMWAMNNMFSAMLYGISAYVLWKLRV